MSKWKKALTGAAFVVSLAGLGAVTASADSIQSLAATAVPVANEYGLYPSVMIAQAILESGSGSSTLATDYNNYFGVKYTSGQGVDLPTTEYVKGQAETVTQTFQVYASAYDSFAAQAELLRSYYPGTLVANTSSYLDALDALQGKYATDPNYANLLNGVITSYDLTAYDGETSYTSAAVATAPSGSYVVKSGDSLSEIAAVQNISVAELAATNGIGQNSILQVGQILSLSAAAISVGASNGNSSGTYTVKNGDSLWTIALAYGTTAANLASINGIDENSLLQIGQQISLSGDVNMTSTSSSGTYTVKPGDTLWSIAENSGHSVSELAQMNGLSNSNLLAVGQVLSV